VRVRPDLPTQIHGLEGQIELTDDGVAEVLGARSVESDSIVHRYQETPSISHRRRRHHCTIGIHARVVGDIAPR
jgi:hypothetical protein